MSDIINLSSLYEVYLVQPVTVVLWLCGLVFLDVILGHSRIACAATFWMAPVSFTFLKNAFCVENKERGSFYFAILGQLDTRS